MSSKRNKYGLSRNIPSAVKQAIKKARDYAGLFKTKGLLNETRYMIGVDDAMLIEKEGEIIVDSKMITDEILAGTRIDPGERMFIVRGFGIIALETGREYVCETRVPFVFLDNKQGVVRKDGGYPLSFVLAYPGENHSIAEQSFEDSVERVWEYSKKYLEELLK